MIKKKLLILYWNIQSALGQFDYLKLIDTERIKRLVFVCRGNVCRSPYAEAAAKSLNFRSISCGVDVEYSAPPEENALRAALLHGNDLSKHMSRSIFNVPLNSSDCLVAMDPSHLSIALSVAKNNGCQVTMMGLWKQPTVIYIPDPYGKPLKSFIECFNLIDIVLIDLSVSLMKVKNIDSNQNQ